MYISNWHKFLILILIVCIHLFLINIFIINSNNISKNPEFTDVLNINYMSFYNVKVLNSITNDLKINSKDNKDNIDNIDEKKYLFDNKYLKNEANSIVKDANVSSLSDKNIKQPKNNVRKENQNKKINLEIEKSKLIKSNNSEKEFKRDTKDASKYSKTVQQTITIEKKSLSNLNSTNNIDSGPINLGEKGGSDFIESKYLDISLAKVKFRPSIKYPFKARKFGYEGKVILHLHVSEKGNVERVEIKKSSGFNVLDNEAMKYGSKFEFYPYKKSNINVPVIIILPVVFQLK